MILNITKKIIKFIYPVLPFTSVRRIALNACGYKVGKQVYLPSTLLISDLKGRRNNVIIGNRVSFGPNVTLITDSSPNNSKLLKVFPLISSSIVIEEDVWIGANAVILPGVTIGKCSVIGAGSVVTKDILPYSVALGIPARIQKNISKDEL